MRLIIAIFSTALLTSCATTTPPLTESFLYWDSQQNYRELLLDVKDRYTADRINDLIYEETGVPSPEDTLSTN